MYKGITFTSVSIRSRLFEAGEPDTSSSNPRPLWFQSAPASLRRENAALGLLYINRAVSIRSRLFEAGEQLRCRVWI